jgi:hypothetical protein
MLPDVTAHRISKLNDRCEHFSECLLPMGWRFWFKWRENTRYREGMTVIVTQGVPDPRQGTVADEGRESQAPTFSRYAGASIEPGLQRVFVAGRRPGSVCPEA